MAKIRSGILGQIRGKVAGVVGSQWKDINYLREYTKPANPNTTAQQAQRSKMKSCVAFAKPLVGAIFNVYQDPFVKSMSGFNLFVKNNIKEFSGTIDYSKIILTEGKLSPAIPTNVSVNSSTGLATITVNSNSGSNGLSTDKVYACVYDTNTELWYFAAAETLRDATSINVSCASNCNTHILQVYLVTAQKVDNRYKLVSISKCKQYGS